MTLYILAFAVWSLLMFYLGSYINSKLDDSYTEHLKRNADFHKDQKERFAEEAREIVKENKNLKERNAQLINENKRLKKELDKQTNTTYNIFY